LNGFAPTPGKIRSYHPPGGIGVRVDSGVYGSYTIPPFYDPLISKLIVWGRDRNEAISRMQRALYEYTIVGVTSNIPFHQAVMGSDRFVQGRLGTHFVDREVTLIDDMRRIVESEQGLGKRLPLLVEDKKRVAAIAAVTAMIGGTHE
jgi:pyruvate carboxylase subunit A